MTVTQLLRLEAIKVRRRSGFQLPVVIFTGFVLLMLGIRIYLGRNSDSFNVASFPAAWRDIHEANRNLLLWFAVITMINVTAPEYAWRTARQNVIDGFSREQFLAGKMLMIPAITLLFVLIGYGLSMVIVGITGGVDGEFMPVLIRKSILGLTLGTLGLTSIALFASIATRNIAGALVLVYVSVALENGVQLILYYVGGFLAGLASYLPGAVLLSLSDPIQYDPETRARAMGTRAPWQGEMLEPTVLVVMALVYIALFLGASYLLVRRRDL